MTNVLGQMLLDSAGWQHMGSFGWFWMVIVGAFWLAVVGLVLWSVGRFRNETQRRSTPDELLAERFARGELSTKEFEDMKEALRR